MLYSLRKIQAYLSVGDSYICINTEMIGDGIADQLYCGGNRCTNHILSPVCPACVTCYLKSHKGTFLIEAKTGIDHYALIASIRTLV